MNPYKANIWKMYAFKFLISLHFIGGVLVPFYLEWGKISFTQIMLLQSIFAFSIFAFEIPTGAIADYLGRKTSIIFASIALLIGPIIYTLYPSIILFIIAEIIWGASYAMLSGADEALVYDSLKKTKSENKSKKIFGRIGSFEIAALTIAAPIGSIIAGTIGLRYTMLFMTVPFICATVLTFFLKEPKTERKIESKRLVRDLVDGVKYFRNHKILKSLAFDRIAISVLVFFIVWTYQPLLTQLNVPIIYFGFVGAGFMALEVFIMNNFDKLERFFKSKKGYLLASALIPGIGFILLGLNPYVAIAVILIIIIGGVGLSRPTLFRSYMNKHIESHHRATVLSTSSMIERFSGAVLYPFIGLLVEFSLQYTLIIIGIIVIVFALLSKVKEEHLID
ncbi:MFS transporter [Candidatus Woesearchaeota archaeon]|nr:MFS transporter [Candidatus Woesearchaeota archaeon]